jgi:hypothetical protein
MKVGTGSVRWTLPLAGVLVALAFVAAPAAQANFKWSAGTQFSGEVETAPACNHATSITIAWGDGSASSPGAFDFNGAVTGNHVYRSPGTFAGTVTFNGGPCAGTQDPFNATVGSAPKFKQCPPVRLDSGCALLIDVTRGGATILSDSTQGPYEDDEDALVGVQNDSSGPITSIPLSVASGPVHRVDLFGFDQDGLCDPGGPPVPSGCVSPPGTAPCGPELASCAFPRPAGEPAGYVEPGALTSNAQNGYEGPTSWFSNVSVDSTAGVINFSPAIPPGGSTYFSLELPPSKALVAGAAPITVTTLDSSSAPTVTASGASFRGVVTPNGLATTAYFQYGLDARYTKAGTSGPVYDHHTAAQSVGGDFAPHVVTASVSNLVPDAIYHARLVATNKKGTSYGPDVQFKTEALPRPGAPVLGKTVNIAPVSGLVLISLQGQVVPLTQRRQVPADAEVDALQGTLKVIAAKPSASIHGTRHAQTSRRHRRGRQSGTFGGAVFRLSQTVGGSSNGLVALTLLEGVFKDAPTFAGCQGGTVSTPLQTLSASARGLFTTRGHFGAVTATRARWTITDRCDGTLTRDTGGSVVVKDVARPRVTVLRRGQSYLSKPKGTSGP